MHLLVTDRLACPRCGPQFGLILLADQMKDRRILEGALGCANCRERYPVEGGFSDLRPPPRVQFLEGDPIPDSSPEDAFRLAALLGVEEGPGLLLLTGIWVAHAARLAAMIEDIEVVAAHPGLRGRTETAGVTRVDMGDRFPFFSGSLRGVALEGPKTSRDLAEPLRVLGPGARVVIRSPAPGVLEGLEEAGMEILLQTHSFLGATRG